MARFGSASQRTKKYLHTAVLGLIALTVLCTLSSVRHLAGAIAARHSFANGSSDDYERHQLLERTQDVVGQGLPHWLHDGSVHRSTTSVRGNTPIETGMLQQWRSAWTKALSGHTVFNNLLCEI